MAQTVRNMTIRTVRRLIERWRAWLPAAWLAIWLGVGIGTSELQGQSTGAGDAILSDGQDSQIKTKLAAAQEDLNRAVARKNDSPPGATAAEFIEYCSALQQLVRMYEFQLDDLSALERRRSPED